MRRSKGWSERPNRTPDNAVDNLENERRDPELSVDSLELRTGSHTQPKGDAVWSCHMSESKKCDLGLTAQTAVDPEGNSEESNRKPGQSNHNLERGIGDFGELDRIDEQLRHATQQSRADQRRTNESSAQSDHMNEKLDDSPERSEGEVEKSDSIPGGLDDGSYELSYHELENSNLGLEQSSHQSEKPKYDPVGWI